jgi:hypothetical protein
LLRLVGYGHSVLSGDTSPCRKWCPCHHGPKSPGGQISVQKPPGIATGRLLAVCCNPPTTGGTRTLLRVNQVREMLGFDTAVVANIFAFPTYRSGDVADYGNDDRGWQEARAELATCLDNCDAVLLAHGVSEPTGSARHLHRSQVAWLHDAIDRSCLPVWWVGNSPLHPSRWQRYTFREFPGVEYKLALRSALSLR